MRPNQLTTLCASILAIVLAALVPASAHGPTPHKAEGKVTIDAPVATVWRMAGDFASIGAWNPLVKKVEAKGGNAPGAERVLLLEKGEITDGLDDYDVAGHTVSWRLLKENVEAFPVSFYTATLAVSDAGAGKSEVVWTTRFYRGDTGNFPPEELNDEAAGAAMNAFIEDGLKGLKGRVEGQVAGKAAGKAEVQ